MTGNEMLKKALIMLGYTNSMGEVSGEQRFRSRALTVLNAIYSDLYFIDKSTGFEPLESVEEEIKLKERILYDVFPYGVAMLLAESENDGDNQQLYSLKYNQKRLSLTSKGKVADVLPYPN